jgi:hypothetical protein
MGEQEHDVKFADDLLRRLPTVPVSSALQSRILDDFDAVEARRRPGALVRLAQRWRDRVWPGAPVWQPISLLAFSLAVGLMAGTLVPASTLTTTTTTTDQMLTSVDSTTAMDLYKDL